MLWITNSGNQLTIMVDNEYRRTKIKLELFEKEGVHWLLSDLLSLLAEENHLEEGIMADWKNHRISELKKKYQEYLKEHEPNGKQQKLFK